MSIGRNRWLQRSAVLPPTSSRRDGKVPPRASAVLKQVLKPSNVTKMAVQSLRSRHRARYCLGQLQRAMQKPARSSRINHKLCMDRESLSPAFSLQRGSVSIKDRAFECHLIDVFHTQCPGFLDEEMIEVRPIPMCVSDLVPRARRNEQFSRMIMTWLKVAVEHVMVKRKTSLQAAADSRMVSLPRSPLRESRHLRQIIALRQFFEEEVSQRRG